MKANLALVALGLALLASSCSDGQPKAQKIPANSTKTKTNQEAPRTAFAEENEAAPQKKAAPKTGAPAAAAEAEADAEAEAEALEAGSGKLAKVVVDIAPKEGSAELIKAAAADVRLGSGCNLVQNTGQSVEAAVDLTQGILDCIVLADGTIKLLKQNAQDDDGTEDEEEYDTDLSDDDEEG